MGDDEKEEVEEEEEQMEVRIQGYVSRAEHGIGKSTAGKNIVNATVAPVEFQ